MNNERLLSSICCLVQPSLIIYCLLFQFQSRDFKIFIFPAGDVCFLFLSLGPRPRACPIRMKQSCSVGWRSGRRRSATCRTSCRPKFSCCRRYRHVHTPRSHATSLWFDLSRPARAAFRRPSWRETKPGAWPSWRTLRLGAVWLWRERRWRGWRRVEALQDSSPTGEFT